jgi:long-subunit acyl-CoA synthetase (AMP-forming)
MAAYLGQTEPMPQWWPSGDLGEVDADGYVYIRGRKKNILISAYGRNISPEWVETALTSQTPILQAVVFGDGEPSLWAVIWATQPDTSDKDLQAAIDRANATLPDYARVSQWVRANDGFHTQSGYATANGRPRRASILAAHAPAHNALCTITA